ncbi:MAG TPA: hypothetical protein VIH86_02460 [Puia sp.]
MLIKPVPAWKEAPFLRLLVPFILGIIVQWYLPVSFFLSVIIFILLVVLLFLFNSIKPFFNSNPIG